MRSADGYPVVRDGLFLTGCVALVAFRWSVIASTNTISGADPGNYVAFGKTIFDGLRVRSSSIVYPPIVPILLRLATGLFGTVTGVHLVAVAFTVAPAIGAFIVLRNTRLGVAAAPLALLASAGSAGEAAAFGGYPQLLATGLTLVMLATFAEALANRSRRSRWLAALLLLLVACTSHLLAAVAVVGTMVLFARRVAPDLRSFRWAGVRAPMSAAAPLAVVPLLVLPVYIPLARGLFQQVATGSSSDQVRGLSLSASLDYVFRESVFVWAAVLAVGLLGLRHRDHIGQSTLREVAISLAVTATALQVATHSYRFAYLAVPVAVLSFGHWVLVSLDSGDRPSAPIRGWIGVALCCVLLAVVLPSGARMFRNQVQYYATVTPEVMSGLVWLKAHTAPTSLVAVNNVGGTPYGWWVEGLAERRTLTEADLGALNFADERRRARMASEIFGSQTPLGYQLETAKSFGVGYLFILKSDPRYSAVDLELLRQTDRVTVDFDDPAVTILALRP